jgi:hypothetical protein
VPAPVTMAPLFESVVPGAMGPAERWLLALRKADQLTPLVALSVSCTSMILASIITWRSTISCVMRR